MAWIAPNNGTFVPRCGFFVGCGRVAPKGVFAFFRAGGFETAAAAGYLVPDHRRYRPAFTRLLEYGIRLEF
jgi:hypothetical protein